MGARGQVTSTSDSWIEPFAELSVLSREALALDGESKARIESGEIVVVAEPLRQNIFVFGTIATARGPELFRLVKRTEDNGGLAGGGVLIAQHAFILIAALVGLVLSAFNRDRGDSPGQHAISAYEEAMSRLSLRDHERTAAFQNEKATLTATLRDREAMARAGELTAGIVHEVRNSIGAIAMQAKLAEKNGDERVREAAGRIGDEVRAIQSVMTRFVDFIRTEEVRSDSFDLYRLVSRVAFREHEHCATTIDVKGEATMVSGDEDLLERAIENVVRNACQAAGPDGRVSINLGIDGPEAIVHVVDDGPGIQDPEKALRPFESNRPGGLGLGLPLVLKILSLHRGTLDLARGPGGLGTHAVCRWPLGASPGTIRNAL